jgi:hypothetical protein
LVHLLSLPEDWVVYKTQIWKEMNMGKNRFNTHWKSLVEKGYIQSIRMIDTSTNLIRGWNHVVYEEPIVQSSDLPDFGLSENQCVYKGIIKQSNNIQSNNIESNNIEVLKEVLEKNSPIEKLWLRK